jgi:hypothetical protein
MPSAAEIRLQATAASHISWANTRRPHRTHLAAGRISASPSLTAVNPLDEIAHHVDGTFVLVVKVTGGKHRRRCFLSAASAEKAARKRHRSRPQR